MRNEKWVMSNECAVSGEHRAVSEAGKPHHRLEAWSEAMGLVKLVYEATQGFPTEERYGLSQQMRRTAVSVPSNIAEKVISTSGFTGRVES